MDIACRIEDPSWQALDLETLAQTATAATLAHLSLDREGIEVSVLATSDAEVAALNDEFRDKLTPTNVLSWPAQDLQPPDAPHPDPDGTLSLGDIAFAYETCAREAAEQGKDFAHHVTHLMVHAVLHLLGYDHIDDAKAAYMEALETEILGNLGIPDPYS